MDNDFKYIYSIPDTKYYAIYKGVWKYIYIEGNYYYKHFSDSWWSRLALVDTGIFTPNLGPLKTGIISSDVTLSYESLDIKFG